MTIVNENAALCSCMDLGRAYRRGLRDEWTHQFELANDRPPTTEEVERHAPSTWVMLGPEGYPYCETCEGRGAFMVDGSAAILSRSIYGRSFGDPVAKSVES